MNPEMTMDSIGNLHGGISVNHDQDLMNSHSSHHSRNTGASLRIHQDLAAASSRSAMVSSMATILDGAGEYRPELSLPLHHAMSMPCDTSPPGMGNERHLHHVDATPTLTPNFYSFGQIPSTSPSPPPPPPASLWERKREFYADAG
ncbi:hypothetical protein SKAU_G00356360 [Synaphobranchus kaupii]|uniref:Uncharacterized protein n=1 Tax=Synaphobranchus kaupii TaxID=118154 RepID=A0A9Q1IFN6_SYNKA|nr:hypothetical protein SKAU_G00356360 [Synaphobranchus kaupii]